MNFKLIKMEALKIVHAKINKYVGLLVVGYYPYLNEIHHFGFATRSGINKDEFMSGAWKIKQLKTK